MRLLGREDSELSLGLGAKPRKPTHFLRSLEAKIDQKWAAASNNVEKNELIISQKKVSYQLE